jgi:hypothetical protein
VLCSEAGILDRFWVEFSAVIPRLGGAESSDGLEVFGRPQGVHSASARRRNVNWKKKYGGLLKYLKALHAAEPSAVNHFYINNVNPGFPPNAVPAPSDAGRGLPLPLAQNPVSLVWIGLHTFE